MSSELKTMFISDTGAIRREIQYPESRQSPGSYVTLPGRSARYRHHFLIFFEHIFREPPQAHPTERLVGRGVPGVEILFALFAWMMTANNSSDVQVPGVVQQGSGEGG